MQKFITLPTGDLLCPRCGSLPRTRRLFDLLENRIETTDKILHFSPPKSLRKKFTERCGANYETTDFVGEFASDKILDITDIAEPDSIYHKVICFHVLEHVEEDLKAMSELKRILKKGAAAFIQTPFKEGEIYEDFTIKSEAERLKHFGQADHVRIYSVAGLKNRLEKVGFQVKVHVLQAEANNRNGYKAREVILEAVS